MVYAKHWRLLIELSFKPDLASMIQSRLNDAAIALDRVLVAANIKYGIFGGYAITALGGPRESKDVDCLLPQAKSR